MALNVLRESLAYLRRSTGWFSVEIQLSLRVFTDSGKSAAADVHGNGRRYTAFCVCNFAYNVPLFAYSSFRASKVILD